MKLLPGVFQAQKKNGEIYFRSSVTFRGRHISLGSYSSQEEAHSVYCTASRLLSRRPPSCRMIINPVSFPFPSGLF